MEEYSDKLEKLVPELESEVVETLNNSDKILQQLQSDEDSNVDISSRTNTSLDIESSASTEILNSTTEFHVTSETNYQQTEQCSSEVQSNLESEMARIHGISARVDQDCAMHTDINDDVDKMEWSVAEGTTSSIENATQSSSSDANSTAVCVEGSGSDVNLSQDLGELAGSEISCAKNLVDSTREDLASRLEATSEFTSNIGTQDEQPLSKAVDEVSESDNFETTDADLPLAHSPENLSGLSSSVLSDAEKQLSKEADDLTEACTDQSKTNTEPVSDDKPEAKTSEKCLEADVSVDHINEKMDMIELATKTSELELQSLDRSVKSSETVNVYSESVTKLSEPVIEVSEPAAEVSKAVSVVSELADDVSEAVAEVSECVAELSEPVDELLEPIAGPSGIDAGSSTIIADSLEPVAGPSGVVSKSTTVEEDECGKGALDIEQLSQSTPIEENEPSTTETVLPNEEDRGKDSEDQSTESVQVIRTEDEEAAKEIGTEKDPVAATNVQDLAVPISSEKDKEGTSEKNGMVKDCVPSTTAEASPVVSSSSGATPASSGVPPLSSDVTSEVTDTFDSNREGADAELCIIPDTEREISQAEKDAASSIPPLRDLTDSSEKEDAPISEQSSGSQIVVFKCEKEDLQICHECKLQRKVKYYYTSEDVRRYLCDDNCLSSFKGSQVEKVALNWEERSLRVKSFIGVNKEPPSLSFIRKCATCKKITDDIENNLTWEIMDFCDEFCLTKYQKEIGSLCSSCQSEVRPNSLGKYCVRFGNDIRQFCTSVCLEKYKKGLKVCSYCQQDMSSGPTGFLAPVGDKGQFKDFCSQVCMEKYDVMTNNRPPKVPGGTICSVCKGEKPISIDFELDNTFNYFCGEPCFVAFSFVNNISPGKCAMCRRHFPRGVLEKHTMYYDNVQHSFCSNSCENIYIIAHRKIVPCSWCKVKKYNFDMIRRYTKDGAVINMCSVNCLSLYRVSMNAANSKQSVCHSCKKITHPMYHLTMSDATIRNFCSYNCVLTFQGQFPKQSVTVSSLTESNPTPAGAPRKNKRQTAAVEPAPPVTEVQQLPIISSVQSLATNGNLCPPPTLTPINTRSTRSKSASSGPQGMHPTSQMFADLPFQVQIKQHFIVRPAPLPEQRNVATMCYTRKANKSLTAKPETVDRGIQTDEREASKILIPVPIPVYVPTPMHMYTAPTLVPVPFPIPVPIPIFIPTTRNSAAGIMKEIKKIQVKIPTDPYEAEILMMAEMVAEEKKEDTTDSESDVDDTGGPDDSYSPEPVDASNTFGDDMLQMALKMATELEEPAVDLEGALTANTITAPQGSETHTQEENVDDPQPMHHHMMERTQQSARGRKRGMRQPRGGAKRGRRMSHHQVDMPMMQHQAQQPPPPPEPAEKPDANMCLKYTFGVNAWKQWVTTKNTELEKSSRRVKLFKTEILQLTADELNYSLCLFVKEVRKPNGAEYAPDTIYYLCLGIQQYLFENGRIDNIFCDPYYEKFTDCLDEVAKKFSVLYNDSHYIVTRVEEEHLWESKQLGAHSPHVLLSTLMFFNTKHFNLTSVDEHMQLSFSHIMKHWKRNPNQPGASKVPGSRNVLLRFYPPQSAIQNNARKKKVYEQQENEENPLRCPVKLYEFYLSKCPESVKTRNDVFYLQPERSCVPDSPVWYSTMPLPKEALEKMLHRVKMVKEINVALLTS